jgi:hypothetical protein
LAIHLVYKFKRLLFLWVKQTEVKEVIRREKIIGDILGASPLVFVNESISERIPRCLRRG